MQRHHLIVISLDAMNSLDFDLIKDMEPFKDFIENGSYCNNVLSVYPSITYPAHTSIITSCYPSKHGIYNNVFDDESLIFDPDWHWYKKDIKVPTLYDYLEEAGFRNSAFMYPVMAGEKRGIVVPEIFGVRDNSTMKIMMKNLPLALKPTALKASKQMSEISQPGIDNFTHALLMHVLKKNKVDTMFIHYTQLDTYRHDKGLFGDHVMKAYNDLAIKVKEIIDQTKKNKTYADTTFVLLGDHGGAETFNDIKLNSLFVKEGLATKGKYGLKNAIVYANSCGGSAHVFVKDKNYYDKTFSLLLDLRDKGYIKEIFTRNEALNKFDLDGPFTFVVEPETNYHFTNAVDDEVVTKYKENKPDHLADHGQLPTNEKLRTMLFMKGRRIKKGAYLKKCSIVDEGVTFGRILGIDMKDVDGRVLSEFIDYNQE